MLFFSFILHFSCFFFPPFGLFVFLCISFLLTLSRKTCIGLRVKQGNHLYTSLLITVLNKSVQGWKKKTLGFFIFLFLFSLYSFGRKYLFFLFFLFNLSFLLSIFFSLHLSFSIILPFLFSLYFYPSLPPTTQCSLYCRGENRYWSWILAGKSFIYFSLFIVGKKAIQTH